MKTIADEIREFLTLTGATQSSLAAASGVPCSTFSNLLTGRRKGVHGVTQDAIRDAIKRLASESLKAPHAPQA